MRYLSIIFLGLLWFLPMTLPAQVYRCEVDGQPVMYQDRPCARRTKSVISKQPAAIAPGLRNSEKDWLEKHKQTPPQRPPKKPATQKNQRQAQRCWQTRNKLSEVNIQLRRGYKPAEGDILRRTRTHYEEYLAHFCAANP